MEFEFLQRLTDYASNSGDPKDLPPHTAPVSVKEALYRHALNHNDDVKQAIMAYQRSTNVYICLSDLHIVDTITVSCMDALGIYMQEQGVRAEIIEHARGFLAQTFQTAVRVGVAIALVKEIPAVA